MVDCISTRVMMQSQSAYYVATPRHATPRHATLFVFLSPRGPHRCVFLMTMRAEPRSARASHLLTSWLSTPCLLVSWCSAAAGRQAAALQTCYSDQDGAVSCRAVPRRAAHTLGRSVSNVSGGQYQPALPPLPSPPRPATSRGVRETAARTHTTRVICNEADSGRRWDGGWG